MSFQVEIPPFQVEILQVEISQVEIFPTQVEISQVEISQVEIFPTQVEIFPTQVEVGTMPDFWRLGKFRPRSKFFRPRSTPTSGRRQVDAHEPPLLYLTN